MMKFNKLVLTGLLAMTPMLAAPVLAEDAPATPQPQQVQPQQVQPGQQPAPQTRTINGLQFKPDGRYGPDKTKFNIVSKKEAEKQQGHPIGN